MFTQTLEYEGSGCYSIIRSKCNVSSRALQDGASRLTARMTEDLVSFGNFEAQLREMKVLFPQPHPKPEITHCTATLQELRAYATSTSKETQRVTCFRPNKADHV